MGKWNFKTIIKEILIGAVILFVVSNLLSYIRKPELYSNQLPQMKVELLNGEQYKPEKGKPLVIHFWATWCPTCKLEASNIQTLSQSYEVLSIAVNSGEDEVLQRYMDEKGLTFKVLNDAEGKWAKKFNIEAFPTTFIYDSKGKLKFTEVGYTTTAGLLVRLKMAD